MIQQSQNTAETIQAWLITEFSERMDIDPDEINVQEPFSNYELSSAEALALLSKLERTLEQRLSATLLWNYPTIEALAQRLAEQLSVSKSAFDIGANQREV
jgi:acyl carrier protein